MGHEKKSPDTIYTSAVETDSLSQGPSSSASVTDHSSVKIRPSTEHQQDLTSVKLLHTTLLSPEEPHRALLLLDQLNNNNGGSLDHPV